MVSRLPLEDEDDQSDEQKMLLIIAKALRAQVAVHAVWDDLLIGEVTLLTDTAQAVYWFSHHAANWDNLAIRNRTLNRHF